MLYTSETKLTLSKLIKNLAACGGNGRLGNHAAWQVSVDQSPGEPAEKLFGSKAKLERYPSLVGRDLERSGKLAEAVPRNKPKEVGFANRSF